MSNVVTKASRTQYLASLRSEVNKMTAPKNFSNRDDDRYWKPEQDKSGTGSAVIRFLPAKTGEEFPFVQLHTHGFQGPTGKWFIENCPTSIGENCPACKANTELWNSGIESDKKLASARKRKLNYISNILVVNDPKHPEHNGKVFLYKYGKKIFEKIKDLIDPPAEFADLEPIDPFNPEFGANFKLRIMRQDGFPNYDKSTFETNETAIGSEDEIAEILGQLNSLNDILEPKNFKTFGELSKRFTTATGQESVAEPNSSADEVDEDVAPPKTASVKAVAPKAGKVTPPKAAKVADSADTDDDFFANLAKQSDE